MRTVIKKDGIYVCRACGNPSPDQTKPHKGRCSCYPPLQPKAARPRRQRFALGDAVERTLSAVGITKELVQKITRKPCGCPARQRWLNQWGYRQQERIEKAVNKAAKWYGIT